MVLAAFRRYEAGPWWPGDLAVLTELFLGRTPRCLRYGVWPTGRPAPRRSPRGGPHPPDGATGGGGCGDTRVAQPWDDRTAVGEHAVRLPGRAEVEGRQTQTWVRFCARAGGSSPPHVSEAAPA